MNNWVKRRLGEVYDVRDGTHDSPKYVKEGYALITSKNLKNDNLNYDNVNYITEQDYVNINKRSKVDVGDVLFAMIGTIGNPIVIKDEPDFAIKNVALFKVPKNQDSYFLKYYLDSGFVIEQMTKDAKGATQKFVGLGYLRNFKIPLPPLPEQQRIVAVLDEAFAAIAKAKANAEQNLNNAKELFESYLQGVFENGNWEEKALCEVCDFMQGIQRDVKLQSENQKDNQVRFLRIVDFTQGNEPPRYIDNPGDKYILNSDDVSLVRYGASTGFVCRGLEGALANNLFRVIPKSKKEISNDFLFVYLTAPVFQKVIKESMNGAAMPAISFGLIKDIPFPVISKEEQQAIVKKLDALSAETKKLETIYQKKITDLEELKKSVLQKAFSGALKEKEVMK